MIRDDAPPPAELPDVWDGPDLDDPDLEGPDLDNPKPGGLELEGLEPYGPEPDGPDSEPHRARRRDADDPRGAAPPRTAPPATTLGDIYAENHDSPAGEYQAPAEAPEAPEPSPLTALTSHVVVPAATITMVSALLFYLYDVRAVFLPGSASLKWIGVCFAAATVLIARYARVAEEQDKSRFYTLALAFVTLLAMWMSPWEPEGYQLLGALSNGLIVLLVWRYASLLTGRLSADLDHPPERPPRLYGLARLEMETWRRDRGDDHASIYDIGRRARQLARPAVLRADGRAASRQVSVLALAGLVIFALGEPLVLAGAPHIAGRALGAMVVFLLAAGVVVAAAACVRDQQRLDALGAAPTGGELVPRLTLGTLLLLAVLTAGLGLPGVETRGSGEIRQLRPSGDARVAESGEQGEVETEGADSEDFSEDISEDFEEAPDRRRDRSSSEGESRSIAWLESLAAIGAWLRWPVLAILVLGGLLALARFGPALLGGLRELAASWWRSVAGRIDRKARQPGPRDPFAAASGLEGLAPRETVLESYGVWLEVCERYGLDRQQKQTPLEILSALPRGMAEMRPAGERLTHLYLLAAYSQREIEPKAAAAARQAIEDLRLRAQKLDQRRAA